MKCVEISNENLYVDYVDAVLGSRLMLRIHFCNIKDLVRRYIISIAWFQEFRLWAEKKTWRTNKKYCKGKKIPGLSKRAWKKIAQYIVQLLPRPSNNLSACNRLIYNACKYCLPFTLEENYQTCCRKRQLVLVPWTLLSFCCTGMFHSKQILCKGKEWPL